MLFRRVGLDKLWALSRRPGKSGQQTLIKNDLPFPLLLIFPSLIKHINYDLITLYTPKYLRYGSYFDYLIIPTRVISILWLALSRRHPHAHGGVMQTVQRTLVLSKLSRVDWLCGAVLVCTMLAACGDHGANHNQPSASTPTPDQSSVSSSSASSIQQTDASAAPGSSDIQSWALQQTRPATVTSSLTQAPPPAAASDPLLPPVIHEAE